MMHFARFLRRTEPPITLWFFFERRNAAKSSELLLRRVCRRTRPMVCFVNIESVAASSYSIFQRFTLERDARNLSVANANVPFRVLPEAVRIILPRRFAQSPIRVGKLCRSRKAPRKPAIAHLVDLASGDVVQLVRTLPCHGVHLFTCI